ncbi:MAG: MarR family transcriptional regulator [Hyphomonadaceae bacterium]|nr:MarR family transcriptional regulator [Clostridia bacterium]
MDKAQYLRIIDDSMMRIQKKLSHEICTDITQSISMTQLHVLFYIKMQYDCTVSFLASQIEITMGGVTQLVEKLVQLQLVSRERDAEDRRIVRLMITHEGEKMLEKVRENRIKIFEKYFSVLSDEEMETFFKIHQKLIQRILY